MQTRPSLLVLALFYLVPASTVRGAEIVALNGSTVAGTLGEGQPTFYSDECLRYRYDLAASKVSEDELSEILELVGPIHSVRTRWVGHVQLCISGNPAYRACGSRTPSAPNFTYNARVNLAQGEALMRRIEKLRGSLAPLKEYFLLQYGVWLDIATRKLDYLQHRNPEILSAPMRGLDVGGHCGSQAAVLRSVEGDDDQVFRALKDWHNCANHLMHDSPIAASGYPDAAWAAFLKEENIVESRAPIPNCSQES